MDKLLTIIIPTYNMEKYLKKCLDSLLVAKNFDLLEVLVVNDGSKDSSSVIAHEYSEKFPQSIRVIDKENGNYGSCINRGILEGSGKYVKVLDADDYFDVVVLDEILELMKTTDVDLFLTDTLQVHEDGSVVKKIGFKIPPQMVQLFADFASVDEMPMHCIAYKLDNVRKLGYKQTEGISYTDTEWAFFPMENVRTCYYYPKVLYRYLIGREGQTMAPEIYKRGRNQELQITKRMVSFWDGLQDDCAKKYADQYLVHRLRRIYMQNMVRGENGDNEFLIEMDSFIKEHSSRLYSMLDDCLYGKREKIHFIRDWRKKYKVPLTFKICVAFHRLLGSQK